MANFLCMPSPFELESGTLYLNEPHWARPGEIRQQLLDETYPKPFVVEDQERRYLYFNVRLMQSAMRLRDPNALDLRYTQQMMAFLLFQPRPRNLLLIGLGGGSIVKFCRTRLPATSLTAVDIDPDVIAFRELFQVPPDDDWLRIIEGDGAAYLATAEKGIDAILVDAFTAEGFAAPLGTPEFLTDAYARLSGQGILVINLAGDRDCYEGLIDRVATIFDGQVIVIPVREDGNHLLFAFRQHHFEPRWRWLHNHAKELRARYGLDFPEMASKLEKAARQGLGRY